MARINHKMVGQILDEIVRDDIRTDYECVDHANSVWRCKKCGHLEQIEGGGPDQDGWNVCPHCARYLTNVMEDEEAAGGNDDDT